MDIRKNYRKGRTMQLKESIIQELPQIPYVIDQVVGALDWAQETLNEGEYNKLLKFTYDVVEFTKSISDPNFFKTHYVVASILTTIPSAKSNERFAKFDSASKAVEKALEALSISSEDIEKYGCFKALMLHLIPLAKENMELFTISLIGIRNSLSEIMAGIKAGDIKAPITANDYISILGYALVISNIRMANISMSNEAYKVYNEISIMLNNELNY